MEFLRQDFATRFEQALLKARREDRHVLVEFGGNWCRWSNRIEKVLDAPPFSGLINQNFEFLRCHLGNDGECYFPFDDFDVPEFRSVPFFVLIDPNELVVDHAFTESFECLWFYRRSKINAWLQNWIAKYAKCQYQPA